MDEQYHIDSRNKVRRVPKRGQYDRQTVHQILDDGEIAHVSFLVDDQPFVIPTLYGRAKDRIYLHGSAASRMLLSLDKGIRCCIAVTMVDGLVLARSAFHHSMNYRSVVLFGTATLVEGEEKMKGLMVISEHAIPGRWDEVRPPNEKELKGTMVLAMDIDQASAKIRTGGPKDEEEDYRLDIWAGILPFAKTVLSPVEDPDARNHPELPESVKNYLRSNE